MPIPISHMATALLSPACHAWANTIDNLFADRLKERVTFLISISKVLQALLALPVLIWLQPSWSLPPHAAIIMAIIALIEFAYVYPYFWAMSHTDTSVVVALFSLGKISIPVLSWFFLHEQLSLTQYLGFFLIISAGLMLTLNPRKLSLNKAAWLMLASSVLLSVESILTKYVLLEGVGWQTATAWSIELEGGIGVFLLAAAPRSTMTSWRMAGRGVRGLFLLEACLSLTGSAGAMLALSLLPVSIAKALSSTQHLFVAFYAKLFHPVWPLYFKERSADLPSFVKYAGLLLTTAGAILAAGYVAL